MRRNSLEEIIIALWTKVAAFKPNTAFFEAYGSGGWLMLERLRIACPRRTFLAGGRKARRHRAHH
ncbi:MAG: hypothetical protein IPH10_08160 [bacterium]|nr:hypothetical protein [bacterium]